jgi:hypothetical protein
VFIKHTNNEQQFKHQTTMKKNLIYTTTEINRNFRIKVFGLNEQGKKINTLMGVAGILRLVGDEMLNKLLRRAFNSMDDVCVCKLRRGLKVSFYVK